MKKTKLKELFAVDLRALALFRISVALIILIQLFDRARVLEALYSDQGLFPRALAIRLANPWDWSLYLSNGSVPGTAFLFLTAAFFAICLLLGYQTRGAAFFSYLFNVSLQNRNVFIPNGGDYLLRLLLFWCLFLPLGERLSLDSQRTRSHPITSHQIISMGATALLLQTAFMYIFSALTKMTSQAWLSGEAVLDALTLEHYARPLAFFLRDLLPAGICKLMTFAVMGVEFFGGLLLFFPFFTPMLRLLAVLLLASLQLGFGLALEVNLFPLVAIAAMLPFLPSFVLDQLFPKRLKEKDALPSRPVWAGSWFGNALAGFFLIYILLSNVEGLTYKSPLYQRFVPQAILPTAIRKIGNFLALDQSWDMFIPPGKVTYWYVSVGKLKDGKVVDILKDGAPVIWEKPRPIFKTEPWRAFLMNLGGPHKDELLPYAGPYFCRKWNGAHLPAESLESFEIYLMSQENERPPQSPTRHYLSLASFSCAKI